MNERSPFLDVPPDRWTASNELAFAFRDAFSVSPGHTLVVPRRVFADWWGASSEEKVALFELVDEVKGQLDLEFLPNGYNVGFNAGAAAGQTVFHLHVHVIPRYEGDVPDPRGGVRHVLPGGNYLAQRPRQLWHGPSHPLGPALIDVVNGEPIERADVLVSFVMQSGLVLLEPLLDRILDRGGEVRVLTGDYLGITERRALERLLSRSEEFGERFQSRLFRAGQTSFHPKAYLLSDGGRRRWAYIGSANASRTALLDGVEWTLGTQDPSALDEASAEFERLWSDTRSVVLTPSVVADYKEETRAIGLAVASPEPIEPPAAAVAPHPVQREALAALEASRAEGFGAGLVVMATGLGKTWLAAFDSTRPQFKRVLFVAHREEILLQARAVFRRVRPLATAGLMIGDRQPGDSDLVFATVQTLALHLDDIDPSQFDYVVIDEFHHAAAATYRRLLGRLRPQFMLGITATPDRADGADLLSLCEDNLVYECGLAEGIERKLLVPFFYFGVPDPVDFRPLPWRNGRFDPDALEHAVIASERMEAALREWSLRRGQRTIAFCVSRTHADRMAEFFRTNGIRAVAVHTGAWSAPRAQSLDQLRTGELEVLFAVDLFNEGLDVPEVDTVLMLRPTSSPVLFLQQLGRGLRVSQGKEALQVVDFVGNHRSFLMPVRLLAGLVEKGTDEAIRRALSGGELTLPPGCSVDYALQAREQLLEMLPTRSRALEAFVESWTAEHGQRPTAAQAFLAGYNPAAIREGWFGLLLDLGLLEENEASAARDSAALLLEVSKTAMNKSYKMVALRAWLLDDPALGGHSVQRNASVARALVLRDPRLVADVSGQIHAPDPAWAAWWRKWPLQHLAGNGSFVLRGDDFEPARVVPTDQVAVLGQLLHELVDWRLTSYLSRAAAGHARLRVSHSSGRPIIRFDRQRLPGLPEGVTPLLAGDHAYEADFVKIALNVVREPDGTTNVLPDLLWRWFGPEAGQPGTAFEVELYQEEGSWHMEPVLRQASEEVG